MVHIFVCLALYLAVILFDLAPMIKNGKKKALYVYIPVFVLTLAVHILYGFGVEIPGPSKPIREAVGWILGVK